MAAYATYRHVELDHVGYGKKRVLKPPGGGTSDIFGVGEQQQSPRKVKQYMASNINLSDEVPASSGPGSTASTTSSNGSVPETPSSPTRNGTETDPQAPDQAPAQAHAPATVAMAAAGSLPDGETRGRNFQMQSHFTLGYDKPPTPVKGGAEAVTTPQEGIPPAQAVLASSPLSPEPERPYSCQSFPYSFRYHYPCRRSFRRPEGGNPVTGEGYGLKPNGTAAPPAAPRTRVPPGGYSSGLW